MLIAQNNMECYSLRSSNDNKCANWWNNMRFIFNRLFALCNNILCEFKFLKNNRNIY